jgi:hypothetical protein
MSGDGGNTAAPPRLERSKQCLTLALQLGLSQTELLRYSIHSRYITRLCWFVQSQRVLYMICIVICRDYSYRVVY